MKNLFQIVKKHVWTLVLLGTVLFGVRWVVVSQRAPGSTTVVEAQAMDMTAMRAPIGTFNVKTDHALEREVGGTETFPATIVAFSDEDVVARIPGLVKSVLVYPGDRVVAGQLLATLRADEIVSSARAESLAAASMRSGAQGAKESLNGQKSAARRAEHELASKIAAVEAAESELQAMESMVASEQESVKETAARIDEASAQLTYAKINYERKKNLYEKGAIARNELDEAQRMIGESLAKRDQAIAQAGMAEKNQSATKSKRSASASMLKQAKAEVEVAREAVGEARASLARAESEAEAMSKQAESASAGAQSSGALSSYTDLRATGDGVVTERAVSPGTPVMTGQTVLKVKVDGELRVQADLPQRLSGKVRMGSIVRVLMGGTEIHAKVTSLFPFVDASTRSFRVEAIVPNHESVMQAGSFARMEIVTSPTLRALTVPRSAVKTASDGTHFVWIVKQKVKTPDKEAIYTCTMHPEVRQQGPGTCPICKMDLVPMDATGDMYVEKRAVKVGAGDSLHTIIVDGLKEGDEVTFEGDDELFPGAAVGGTVDGGDSLDSHSGMNSGAPQSDGGIGGNTGSTMPGHERHTHTSRDKFTCPMHPDVHKSEPGACPVCKMDLVPIKDK